MNIDKRIKELQNDRKYTFKLTEDVIDMIYRTAVEDMNANQNIESTTTSEKEHALQKKIDSLNKTIEELRTTVNKQKKVKSSAPKTNNTEDYKICKYIMSKIYYDEWSLMDVYEYLKTVVPL